MNSDLLKKNLSAIAFGCFGVWVPFQLFTRFRRAYENFSWLDFALIGLLAVGALIFVAAQRQKDDVYPFAVAGLWSITLMLTGAWLVFPGMAFPDQLFLPVFLGPVAFHPNCLLFGVALFAGILLWESAGTISPVAAEPKEKRRGIIILILGLGLGGIVVFLNSGQQTTAHDYYFRNALLGAILTCALSLTPPSASKSSQLPETPKPNVLSQVVCFLLWVIGAFAAFTCCFVLLRSLGEYREHVYMPLVILPVLFGLVVYGILVIVIPSHKILLQILVLGTLGCAFGFYLAVVRTGPDFGLFSGQWLLFALAVGGSLLLLLYPRLIFGQSARWWGFLGWCAVAYAAFIPTHNPFLFGTF
jgi:hypothetical protein